MGCSKLNYNCANYKHNFRARESSYGLYVIDLKYFVTTSLSNSFSIESVYIIIIIDVGNCVVDFNDVTYTKLKVKESQLSTLIPHNTDIVGER